MEVSVKDFELFEQQFTELISEFQTLSTSEGHLRSALRAEAVRAEAAEAARDAALRASAETQASAAAATAGAAQASRALVAAQDELVTVKMQFDLAERQRALFEENCTEVNYKLNAAERELQELRQLQTVHATVKQQFIDLQKRIQKATEDAERYLEALSNRQVTFHRHRRKLCRVEPARRKSPFNNRIFSSVALRSYGSEASLLENELRHVSRCAGGGAEVRERARLAAAAHARDKRLAADEMKHTTRELQTARAEIARLTTVVVELQCQLSKNEEKKANKMEHFEETIAELRASLEAERNSTTSLEKTLASALADNATLAAKLHNNDNDSQAEITHPVSSSFCHDCPIDSFLAE